MDSQLKNLRLQKWIAFFSVILLLAKLFAYFLTHSVAVLSDALEGIVNVAAGFLGWYSLSISAKPKDYDHPYGHGKIEFISAGIEGGMILIAGILIFYEGVKNLIHPKPLLQLDIGILLISIAGLFNFIMGFMAVKTGKKSNSLALIASGKHLQSDTYTTLGVLVGLALVYFTDLLWIDSLTGIIFSGVIIYTGYSILRKSVAGIMDESDHKLLEKVADTLEKNRRQNWIDFHNLRIIKYGSKLHLDCHLTVPWYLTVREAHVEVEVIAQLVRKEFGKSLELFIHEDDCQSYACKICLKQPCPERKFEYKNSISWNVKNLVEDKEHGAIKD